MMRVLFLLVAMAACVGSVMAQPTVYPNIQELTAANGNFKLSGNASIVYSENDYRHLKDDLLQFQGDLEAVSGMKLKLSHGNLETGDIQFVLGTDIEKIGMEGYLMDIGKTVVVSANTVQGIFYGMQTWMKMNFIHSLY